MKMSNLPRAQSRGLKLFRGYGLAQKTKRVIAAAVVAAAAVIGVAVSDAKAAVPPPTEVSVLTTGSVILLTPSPHASNGPVQFAAHASHSSHYSHQSHHSHYSHYSGR
jgi:hypothetical protein